MESRSPDKAIDVESPEEQATDIWGGELEHEVHAYQDVSALYYKSSESVMICDALFAVTEEPPKILTDEEEYTRALLFHARGSDAMDEMVEDTLQKIDGKVGDGLSSCATFLFLGSERGNLGPVPILEALMTPLYNKDGWGGWRPFSSWGEDEEKDFETFGAKGNKPTILPIIQIILALGPEEVHRWLGVCTKWNFKRVVPMHLDAPLAIGPFEFPKTFDFTEIGRKRGTILRRRCPILTKG